MTDRPIPAHPASVTLDRLLTARDVASLLRLTVSGFHTMRNRDKTFPAPIAAPFRGMRWRASDVDAWVRSLSRIDEPARHPGPLIVATAPGRLSDRPGPLERLSRRANATKGT